MMEMTTTERIILQKRKKRFQAREPCIKNAFQEERLIVWPEYTLSFNVYRGLCFLNAVNGHGLMWHNAIGQAAGHALAHSLARLWNGGGQNG